MITLDTLAKVAVIGMSVFMVLALIQATPTKSHIEGEIRRAERRIMAAEMKDLAPINEAIATAAVKKDYAEVERIIDEAAELEIWQLKYPKE